MNILRTEYKGYVIYRAEDVGSCHTEIGRPDGSRYCIYRSDNISKALERGREIIDSLPEIDIIDDMNVTKPHVIQIGDVVTTRGTFTTTKKVKIGIVEHIEDSTYYVDFVKKVNLHYLRVEHSVPHQLEDLSLYPNREKWVEIKRDLDRRKDGEILQDWIENK